MKSWIKGLSYTAGKKLNRSKLSGEYAFASTHSLHHGWFVQRFNIIVFIATLFIRE